MSFRLPPVEGDGVYRDFAVENQLSGIYGNRIYRHVLFVSDSGNAVFGSICGAVNRHALPAAAVHRESQGRRNGAVGRKHPFEIPALEVAGIVVRKYEIRGDRVAEVM